MSTEPRFFERPSAVPIQPERLKLTHADDGWTMVVDNDPRMTLHGMVSDVEPAVLVDGSGVYAVHPTAGVIGYMEWTQ